MFAKKIHNSNPFVIIKTKENVINLNCYMEDTSVVPYP